VKKKKLLIHNKTLYRRYNIRIFFQLPRCRTPSTMPAQQNPPLLLLIITFIQSNDGAFLYVDEGPAKR
jgi:hypothetical protein